MKKIVVIAYYEKSGEFYRQHIQEIFGALVDVECCCIESNRQELDLEADLIVATSDIIFEHIKKLNKSSAEIIIIKRTFTKAGFQKIKELKYDEEILFVSTFYEMAVETTAQLYEMGIRDLKLVPYNPVFQDGQSSIKIAVTAGESNWVPSYVESIIDIGDRVLDISNIADIGAKLSIPAQRMNNLIDSYKKEVVCNDTGFQRMMDATGELKKQMNTILTFISDSIIAVNNEGCITEYSEASESIFGLKMEIAVGMEIENFFGSLRIMDSQNKKPLNPSLLFDRRRWDETLSETDKAVVYLNNNAVVISQYPIRQEGKLLGMIFVSQKYIEVENEHNRLRSKLIPKGHVAKYTFDSVLGGSEKVCRLKAIADKMAKSSSTILITGESGTGKEVFAQAIHNASSRKGKPFLAVNCSAFAANLLESELFGYEEGAFTGAKKGGKVGLFELADGGTIFLDEIGEMPYEMQAKLLRVLMEREIMRVGGTNLIHVNVRVIAATNKDLVLLMEKGAFREDLYYRLNVLPLALPPLRERQEDVVLLARHFFCEFGGEKFLTQEAERVLVRHNWPGNVRELRNCVEYMYQMSETAAGPQDIPEYITNGMKKFSKKSDHSHEAESLILSVLLRLNGEHRPAGRKAVSQELSSHGFMVSEQETRFLLKQMEERGLVQVYRGPRGCVLTTAGNALAQGERK